jgi:hypothetical protein
MENEKHILPDDLIVTEEMVNRWEVYSYYLDYII